MGTGESLSDMLAMTHRKRLDLGRFKSVPSLPITVFATARPASFFAGCSVCPRLLNDLNVCAKLLQLSLFRRAFRITQGDYVFGGLWTAISVIWDVPLQRVLD
jgi:hypothetical protein